MFKHETWLSFSPQNRQNKLVDGFGNLAVFNEIRLSPGGNTEPHLLVEAEIVNYVYRGAIAH